jgi:hypothetical protein
MRGGHRKRDDQSNTIAVGSRGQTTDSPPKMGVVVEDFGDLAGVQVIIDRDHSAQSRRWAIMLDPTNRSGWPIHWNFRVPGEYCATRVRPGV